MKLKDKIRKFAAEHEAIWQLIKFTIISSIAGITEITSYTLLNSVFLKSMNAQPFHWWIFRYDGGVGGGLGTMIAFLVSTTLAQIVSFVTNRKKTFNADNNIVFSAIIYAVMVIAIICLQTYTGPLIVIAIDKWLNNAALSGTLGKLIWMFLSFVIIFPMNKFVIMRKKKQPAAESVKTVEE